MSSDEARDDLDCGDDDAWRPLFGCHTPLAEIVEIIEIEALAVYRATVACLEGHGVHLTVDAQRQIARLIARRTARVCLAGYLRLRREADA